MTHDFEPKELWQLPVQEGIGLAVGLSDHETFVMLCRMLARCGDVLNRDRAIWVRRDDLMMLLALEPDDAGTLRVRQALCERSDDG